MIRNNTIQLVLPCYFMNTSEQINIVWDKMVEHIYSLGAKFQKTSSFVSLLDSKRCRGMKKLCAREIYPEHC